MPTEYPKVTVNHDWLGIRFGNNRSLSVSWGGCKATGKIPQEVFDLWDKATRHDSAVLKRIGIEGEDKPILEKVVRAFAANIDKLWPEWNARPKLPAVGDTIVINFGKRKGNDQGEVTKIRGTMVHAKFKREGSVRVPADMIEQIL